VDEHAFSAAERQAVYTRLTLKVEGILECAELFVVALGDDRRQNLWLGPPTPALGLPSCP
jgi:hypothetical protein